MLTHNSGDYLFTEIARTIDFGYCLLIGITRTTDLEGGLLIGIVRAIDFRCCLLVGIARTVDTKGGLLTGIVRTSRFGDCPLLVSGPLITETAYKLELSKQLTSGTFIWRTCLDNY